MTTTDYTIFVDLNGYGDPRPVDARTLTSECLISLCYEADVDALTIIDRVLTERDELAEVAP